RHTRFSRDWSSDVCSSDLGLPAVWFTLLTYLKRKVLPLASMIWFAILDGTGSYCANSMLYEARPWVRDRKSLAYPNMSARGTKRSEERRVGQERRASGRQD